jgi:hypothetical protein
MLVEGHLNADAEAQQPVPIRQDMFELSAEAQYPSILVDVVNGTDEKPACRACSSCRSGAT